MSKDKAHNKQPFEDLFLILKERWKLTDYEAVQEIQSRLEKFNDNQEHQKQRNSSAANSLELSRIAHTTTLSTLTLSVIGFLSAQLSNFNSNHKVLILLIMIFEVISLFFSMIAYYQAINFHKKWAATHQDIQDELGVAVDTALIQVTEDMKKIEARHYKQMSRETNVIVTHCMVGFALSGLVLVLVLFYSYLFDVPFIS